MNIPTVTSDPLRAPEHAHDVFMSYAREDREMVLAYKALFEGRGFTTWLDESDIRVGDVLTDEIERAIASCGAVVVFWSAAARASAWVDQEASAALRHGRLLPVSLDETGPGPGYENLHTLPLLGQDAKLTDTTKELLARIGDLSGGPSKSADPAVQLNPLDSFSVGKRMTLSGVVYDSAVGMTRSNEPYVGFTLRTSAGPVPCRHWGSDTAPSEGSIVSIAGSIVDSPRYGRQFTVKKVESVPVVAPQSRYHALLDFLSRELRDSDRASLTVTDGGEARSVLLTEGQEPTLASATTDSAFFGDLRIRPDKVQTAKLTELALERGYQEVRLGYPLVRVSPIGARESTFEPLATLAVDVIRSVTSPSGFRVRSVGKRLELNPAALKALEVPEDTIDELQSNSTSTGLDLLRLALEGSPRTGGSTNLLPDALSPDNSGPVSNIAALLTPETGPITRTLLRDYDRLRSWSPEDLAHSALGTMVDGLPPQDEPLAFAFGRSVGRATLAQEEASASALERRLTVVTGPPGTGKSQLIANVVAAMNHEYGPGIVAVTSTNNAAVDAVAEKTALSDSLSLVVRFGTNHGSLTAQHIRSALQHAKSEQVAPGLEERWRELAERTGPLYQRDFSRRLLEAEYKHLARTTRDARVRLSPAARRCLDSRPAQAFEDAAGEIDDARAAASKLPWWRWRARRAARSRAEEVVLSVGQRFGLGTQDIAATLTALREISVADRTLSEHGETLAASPGRAALDDDIDALVGPERNALSSQVEREQKRFRTLGMAPEATAAAESLAQLFENGKGKGEAELVEKAAPLIPAWCTTLHSSGQIVPLRPGAVELLVIDEASQCLLAVAAPMLARANRAMIVGDPQQLSAIDNRSGTTQRELNAYQAGLSDDMRSRFTSDKTLYDLAAEAVSGDVVLLDRHFRCHEDIARFSLDTFYGGQVAVRTAPVPARAEGHIRWIDCTGATTADKPRQNRPEAEAVVDFVSRLVAGGQTDIGIIVPFGDQKHLVGSMLKRRGISDEHVTVGTVHAFQGSDRQVIVFSPVVSRTTAKSRLNFVDNAKMINVAVTRARSLFVVVGDREVSRGGQHLGALVDHIESIESRDSQETA